MNLLPQRQSQTLTITVSRFSLRDVPCLSWPASGRGISWELPAGLRLGTDPMIGKQIPIPVLQNWRYMGYPLAAGPPHVCRLHFQALPILKEWWAEWFEAAQPGGLPISKQKKCRDSQRSGDGLEVTRRLHLSLPIIPILFLKSNRSKRGRHLVWRDFAYNITSFICLSEWW